MLANSLRNFNINHNYVAGTPYPQGQTIVE